MRESRATKYLLIVLTIAIFIYLASRLHIFSVYQKGGPLSSEETKTIGLDGRTYSLSSELMLEENHEIRNQTLIQVIYRYFTDNTRKPAERIVRIGLTL